MEHTQNHDDARWWAALSAMLDGEEPVLPAGEVAAHLSACPGCWAWLDKAMAMNAEVSELPFERPDLGERVVNSVDVHLCACRTGGECLCADCQCGPECTCRQVS